MRNEPILDQMVTTGNGGCHHAGRHTGKYHTMTVNELLRDPTLQDLREASDVVEAICQRFDGTYPGAKNR